VCNADFHATRELIAEEILTLQGDFTDPDGDTLSTATERELGTDPFNDDTDGDWLRDGVEVNIIGTDPLDVDSDNDNSSDFAEIFFGSNPLNSADHP
jgi:hypothetical protein